MSSSAVEMAVKGITRNQRILCPACSGTRKKHKTEKTLSVTFDGPVKIYHCFHCNISGKISQEKNYDTFDDFLRSSPAPVHTNVIELPAATHDRQLHEFLGARGISRETASRYGVVSDVRWFNKSVGETLAVGFVYGDRKEPSAIKWRSLQGKSFIQTGAAQTFYGLEQLPEDLGELPLVICEGELDVLSCQEAAIQTGMAITAISVPNGAPANLKQKDDGTKYNYVWESRRLIEAASKVILFTDRDQPGENLKTILARKIGRGKCWQVSYPNEEKDANEVLCSGPDGANALKEMIETATPMPLTGVYAASDYEEELMALYEKGYGRGLSTGFKSLDEILTIAPGLHVVTGSPSMGKSEFVDALALNLSLENNLSWAVCSMENPVSTHLAKLSEKIVGKRFYEGPSERMSRAELDEAKAFIEKHFVFLEQKDGNLQTIDSIIDSTKQAIMRFGSTSYGLIIDPYNFVEQGRSRGNDSNQSMSISEMLSKLIAFGQSHDLIIFFVAHPVKQYPNQDGKYPVPDGHSISGSAAWLAKSQCGITVHRSGNPDDNQPEIHVWKMRFKWHGKMGSVKLNYDVNTGRFSDLPRDENFDWSVKCRRS